LDIDQPARKSVFLAYCSAPPLFGQDLTRMTQMASGLQRKMRHSRLERVPIAESNALQRRHPVFVEKTLTRPARSALAQ
jgi:hypothetical protein